MTTSAGLRAVAVTFPKTKRNNEYFRVRHPEIVADADRRALARIWAAAPGADVAPTAWDVTMAPYLSDPFRGAVERRVLGPGQAALDLEIPCAKAALAAAGLAVGNVDLLICLSFFPDQIDIGNASFLARALDMRCAAWNLESACAGPLIALQTACGLVTAGQHENVLVVTSCTYSRFIDETDTIAWVSADGAGAFVVGRVPEGAGLLGAATRNTIESCGALGAELVPEGDGKARVRLRSNPGAGKMLRDSSLGSVRAVCGEAARRAGVSLGDIDFLVCNTPTAWYAAFCARMLEIDPTRTIDTHARYANIGPALLGANLWHAAESRRIHPGDLVLLFSIGSSSNATAAVMRWGDVAIAPFVEV